MIRLSGARCLAMSVAGILFGLWSNSTSIADMTLYRGLTHEALLNELASRNDSALSTSIMGGLFVVIGVVLIVDILHRFFRALWRRIEPPASQVGGTRPPEAAA